MISFVLSKIVQLLKSISENMTGCLKWKIAGCQRLWFPNVEAVQSKACSWANRICNHIIIVVWEIWYANCGIQLTRSLTFPGAHSVPSTGGPFLVLQKYWLSGWLHHSCLHGSYVRNWRRRERERWRWSHISSKCNNVQAAWVYIHKIRAKYLQRCTSYNPHRNQSGTAHPSSSLSREALWVWAISARTDHPEDSRTNWKKHSGLGKVLSMITQKTQILSQFTLVLQYFLLLDAKEDLLQNVLIGTETCIISQILSWDVQMITADQILTGCIDWAPVCCSGTSDIGETRPGRAEPWCCPCWSHLNSGSPDRHAPYPAWNIEHNHQNTAQYNHTECPVRFVSMNQFIPTHWFLPVQHFIFVLRWNINSTYCKCCCSCFISWI